MDKRILESVKEFYANVKDQHYSHEEYTFFESEYFIDFDDVGNSPNLSSV